MAVTLGYEVLFRKKAGYQALEKHVILKIRNKLEGNRCLKRKKRADEEVEKEASLAFAFLEVDQQSHADDGY